MRGTYATLAAGLLIAIALAGCAQPGQQNWTLTVTDAPAQADVGDTVTISWDLDGPETTTDHTAVHFSLSSTAGEDEVTLADFQALTEVKTGDVPGSYEATFEMPFPGIVHFRAHTIIDGDDYFSDEQTIQVDGTPVEVTDAPTEVQAGPESFTVSWRVRHLGQTQIPHTAIHYGPESKDQPAKGGNPFAYPELTPKPAHSGQIPATFSAEIPAPKPGDVYFRGHAVIDETNWLSAEQHVQVVDPDDPNVVLLDVPGTATVDEPFNVTMQVNAPNATASVHVGVETSDQSHDRNVSMYDEGPHEPAAAVPGEFTFEVSASEAGPLYLRGHYRTLNGTDVLSREARIDVHNATGVVVTQAPDCVETGDNGDATVEATFEVSAPKQRSEHIGIHHDTTSHAGDDAKSGDYAEAGPHEGGDLPGTFTRNFTVSSEGTHYFRAHTLLADGTSLLSQEQSVDVKSGGTYDSCI